MAYEVQTKQNDNDVTAFLEQFKTEERYEDLIEILNLMQKISGCPPKMWGKSIIGFDRYKYKGKSSEGEWFCLGLSPRKQNISLYIISGFEQEKELLKQLGKYKTGKGCLYIKRLSDIEFDILEEFLKRSMTIMKQWNR